MSQNILERWSYQLQDTALCITLSRDGRFIFAGSKDGYVYCFEQSGTLLWQGNVESQVSCLALAEGSEYIIVACMSGKAYLWNYEGHLLHTFETTGSIQSISVTPTAHRIALGTNTGILTLFNPTGTLLWQYASTSSIGSLSLSSDGQVLVFGSDDLHIFLFTHQVQPQLARTLAVHFWASSQNTPPAIVSSKDQHIFLLGSAGHVRWSYPTGDEIKAAAITFDGRGIVAGTAQVILRFNNTGDLLWQYPAGDTVQELTLSSDGRFVIARTQNHRFLLLDSTGTCLWTHHKLRKAYAVATTPNGRLLATAQDRSISLFENPLAPEDMTDAWLAQIVLSQIRRAYAISPQLGIAAWFETFDYALVRRELALCQTLLQEMRESDYHLSASEQNAVTSREGSLLLYQGLFYHQHKDTTQAQQRYERSRELQRRSRYQIGEGQSLTALQMLRSGAVEDDSVLFTLLVSPPELLGSSEMLLAQRIGSMSPYEQLQMILTARRKGYLTPLLAALSSPHASVQTAAATALTWLQPGPEMSTLLNMLNSPHWPLRWQASFTLTQHAKQQAFAPHYEQVRHAVVERLAQEEDPLVRRTLTLLLGIIGDSTHEAVLLPLLADTDPDVRIAVVETLGLIGTRHAVTALQQAKDGIDFIGRSIKELTDTALDRIYQRYPLTVVKKVVCCQELPTRGKSVQPATLFFPNTPVIHCIVTLEDPTVGAKISCMATLQNQPSLQQENEQLQPLWTIEPEAPSTDMIFSFAPPVGTWRPGVYIVEVLLDGKLQEQLAIKIINQVPIKDTVMCSGVNARGEPIGARTTFTSGHGICCSVALEEAPIGLEVKGIVYRVEDKAANRGFFHNLFGKATTEHAERYVFMKESKSKTAVEGTQSIALSWKPDGWPAGDYIIKLTTSTGAEASCNFQIVSLSTQ